MGITNSNKELSTQRIDCGDSFRMRLSLTAEPDIVTSPTDIVLGSGPFGEYGRQRTGQFEKWSQGIYRHYQ